MQNQQHQPTKASFLKSHSCVTLKAIPYVNQQIKLTSYSSQSPLQPTRTWDWYSQDSPQLVFFSKSVTNFGDYWFKL